MFKRENRLVPGIRFGSSSLSANSQFILKEKDSGLKVNRFGIVVSKKIDKRAVIRNKIKRIFRDTLFRLNRSMMPGHDILFIVKTEILNKSKEEIQLAIESALEKAGLIKDE